MPCPTSPYRESGSTWQYGSAVTDTTGIPVEEDQGEEEDGIIIQPLPTAFQALQGLRTVLRFQEYAPSAQHEDIHLLQQLERQLQQLELNSCTQRTLDSWLL